MSILYLIRDYLADVDRCLAAFGEKFGRRDLVRAWREGALPGRGELAEGVPYYMHGVGCAVEFPDYDLDFDFANQHDVGFDAWRLWQYAEQFPARYPDYLTLPAVEAGLAASLAEGALRRIETPYRGEGNDNLLQLSDAEASTR